MAGKHSWPAAVPAEHSCLGRGDTTHFSRSLSRRIIATSHSRASTGSLIRWRHMSVNFVSSGVTRQRGKTEKISRERGLVASPPQAHTPPRLSHHRFTLRIPDALRRDLQLIPPRLRRLDYYAMNDETDSLSILACAAGSLSSPVISSTPTSNSANRTSAVRNLRTLIWDPSMDPEGTQLRLQRLALVSIGCTSSPKSFAQKLLDASTVTLKHLPLIYAERISGGRDAYLDLRQLQGLNSIHVTFSIAHSRAIIAMLACLWCNKQFPALSSLSLRISISLKDFTSTEQFGLDVGRNWAELRLPLLLMLSNQPPPDLLHDMRRRPRAPECPQRRHPRRQSRGAQTVPGIGDAADAESE